MKRLAKKRFGQHFLHSLPVLQQILSAIRPQTQDHLIEIGPGEGVLTALLIPLCQRLDAIEIDSDLVAHLTQRFNQHKNSVIHQHDILDFALSSLTQQNHSLRIVGNLPYNISSPLLFKLFSQLPLIKDMHFMLQKEVVLRMTATVGSHDYNRLSVMSQYFCDNTLLFDVDRHAFSPAPQVDSAVVRLLPKQPEVSADNLERFAHVVKTAFMQRRKNLKNCLSSCIGSETLEKLGIKPTCRPQELSVSEFVKISNCCKIE